MPRFFIILLLCLTGHAMAQQPIFSRQQLQQDLNYLDTALRELHPGLFRYQSPAQFDSAVQATHMAIRDQMPLRDAYASFSSLVAGIRCAHTVLVPRSNWADTLRTAKFYLPFQVFFIRGDAYLVVNRSSNQDVHPGDRLLSINDRPITAIRDEIFRHLFSDGYIETLKYRQIHDQLFSYFYNCFIEQADSFRVTYQNAGGETKTITVPALDMTEMNRNVFANPVNQFFLQEARKQKPHSHELSLDKEKKIATIYLWQFFGGKNGAQARAAMNRFMDESLAKISRSGITDLIVDLRYNGGGYDNQGQALLSYFIDQPVLYYRSMRTVTNSSPLLAHSSLSPDDLKQVRDSLVPLPDGTYRVPVSVNPTLDSVRPAAQRFKGNVYFLVNGATGSTTAEFTAVAHHLRVGTFIGDETGGNYTGGNGGEFVGLLLPNTRMHVTIPVVRYENAVDHPAQEGRGTIPDYPDNYTITEAVSNRDTARELAYRLIAEKRAKGQQ
ncbi:S41 family peptidase [Chitinophaga qingshengii]|uniref:Tail specific protease domain-containing protein n=1 Tax=Chitinophaga qingshengii TaxID=1569794 RepID=A0ABR7TS38_9BACT|nr:S41 family peptidase [Chitinophaga qingshengii]MBC9933304.1 hypothetical protein [Chitinophaga qingshengii]